MEKTEHTRERLAYRTRFGWTAYLALIPALFFAVLGWLVFRRGDTGADEWLMPWVASALMLLFCVALHSFRYDCVLDRSSQRLTQAWTVLGYSRPGTRALTDFQGVCIAREKRPAGKSSYMAAVVRLHGTGAPVELSAPADPAEAQRLAREVAEFLNIPLTDAGTENSA